jgi:hypothetical protein
MRYIVTYITYITYIHNIRKNENSKYTIILNNKESANRLAVNLSKLIHISELTITEEKE